MELRVIQEYFHSWGELFPENILIMKQLRPFFVRSSALICLSFDTHLPPKSPSKNEELKEKDSSDSINSSQSKGSSPPPSSFEKVHMPLPPFPYRLKKKDQAHVEKIREIFSQVKINH